MSDKVAHELALRRALTPEQRDQLSIAADYLRDTARVIAALEDEALGDRDLVREFRRALGGAGEQECLGAAAALNRFLGLPE